MHHGMHNSMQNSMISIMQSSMHNDIHSSMHNGMQNSMHTSMHNCVRGQTQPRADAAEDESGGRAPGTPNAERIEGSSRIQMPKKLSIVAAERSKPERANA